MKEKESPIPILFTYQEEVPSTWKREVQEKPTLSHLKGLGRKKAEGRQIGQGTMSSSFLR